MGVGKEDLDDPQDLLVESYISREFPNPKKNQKIRIHKISVRTRNQRQMRIPKKPKNQVWKSETEITLNPSIRNLTQ